MSTLRVLRCAVCLIFLGLSLNCRLQGQGGGADFDPSLKLHFDFDQDFSNGRVLDVSGNGNDGWQFNPTNWITSTNGIFGSTAAYFTNVGVVTNDPPHKYPLTQYIGVTNLNGIKYLTNATISMWARFDATNNGHNLICLMDCGYTAVYSWSPSQASNSWTWGKINFQNYLSFWVYPDLPNGGYQNLVTWPDDTVGGDNESTTNIHLYSITIDCPGNQAIAYYDGQPYMTNVINLPWIRIYGTRSDYWVNWLCIGASSHDGTPWWGDDRYPNDGYFTGAMDDVRIYDRTLPAAEVQNLYLNILRPHLTAQMTGAQSIQICWDTQSNVSYQVESRSDLLTGGWLPFGSPVQGDNSNQCVVDSSPGQTNRFYRIRMLP